MYGSGAAPSKTFRRRCIVFYETSTLARASPIRTTLSNSLSLSLRRPPPSVRAASAPSLRYPGYKVLINDRSSIHRLSSLLSGNFTKWVNKWTSGFYDLLTWHASLWVTYRVDTGMINGAYLFLLCFGPLAISQHSLSVSFLNSSTVSVLPRSPFRWTDMPWRSSQKKVLLAYFIWLLCRLLDISPLGKQLHHMLSRNL